MRTSLLLFTAVTVWLGLRADRLHKETSIAELRTLLDELPVTDLDKPAMRFVYLSKLRDRGLRLVQVRRVAQSETLSVEQ